MRFDLIALDLDDTLLHTDLSISEANRSALRRAHAAGAKIVLASGRNIFSMRKYAEQLGVAGPDDYIISTNGAEIVETGTGRVLFERRISAELCREVAAAIEAKGFPWQIYVNGVIHYKGWNHWTEEDSRLTGMPNRPIADEEGAFAGGQLKFIVPGEPERIAALNEEMRALIGDRVEVLVSKPYFMEVLPSGVDKGIALEELAGRLGIGLERTLAMGDAANDLGMLRAAGFSCAPANAIAEAKSAAGWVSALGNDEDFVADALERWMEYA